MMILRAFAAIFFVSMLASSSAQEDLGLRELDEWLKSEESFNRDYGAPRIYGKGGGKGKGKSKDTKGTKSGKNSKYGKPTASPVPNGKPTASPVPTYPGYCYDDGDCKSDYTCHCDCV